MSCSMQANRKRYLCARHADASKFSAVQSSFLSQWYIRQCTCCQRRHGCNKRNDAPRRTKHLQSCRSAAPVSPLHGYHIMHLLRPTLRQKRCDPWCSIGLGAIPRFDIAVVMRACEASITQMQLNASRCRLCRGSGAMCKHA